MDKFYFGLYELINDDPQAKAYYDKLPGYVREHIQTRGHNVNSFDSLKDYAENLTRGDG
jgi:hypothetical protein